MSLTYQNLAIFVFKVPYYYVQRVKWNLLGKYIITLSCDW